MFRELTRKNNEISCEECIEILRKEKRGVLSVYGTEGYPYAMPMNQWYNEKDGCIYFHCGKSGHRNDAIAKNSKVSFCVIDEGRRNEGEWAYNFRSVIVFGEAEIIDDLNEVIEITTELSHKFTDDEDYIKKEIESALQKTVLIKLKPNHICGKRVKEA